MWLIPASLALLIPIIAILSDAPTALVVLIGGAILALAIVGGSWFLMQERHKLRMREIEAEAHTQRAAREHLSVAERILDKDDGLETLRREDPPALTN
jgi:hypothetical protein